MGTDEARGVGGSLDGDPFGHTDPVDPIDAFLDEGPIDIAAVRRDDALINAIAGDGPVATDSADEYQLAMLLSAWRAELNSTPMPAGPDLDTVVAAVNEEIAAVAAMRNGRRRLRLLGPVTAAAAVIAVVTGITAISYNANPGDPLWSVKEAVFSKQADSTMARIDSSTDLDAAEQALAQGDVNGAKSLLERAGNRASDVDNSAHRGDLEDRLAALRTELEEAGGLGTMPIPLPSLLPPITTGSLLPPLLLPSTTSTSAPSVTDQLIPDSTASSAAAPTQELPLLVPTTQPPLTVDPDEPTQPYVPPVEPTTIFEPTTPSVENPPASDTNTLIPPPVDNQPGAEVPPPTTIRSDPPLLPHPGAVQPGGLGVNPDGTGGL
ncbi:anti-sigma-D factor RsdA [Aldersonia kunmingensis]|uniref:anti-sigma-D factor RsdA n=1 Tax=Aldersonia kunmingensis TaxID=408066 RepID=UPI0009FDBEFF|nr:anti-sigma-D factor RsdA [Aldersonia kunmingensis]